MGIIFAVCYEYYIWEVEVMKILIFGAGEYGTKLGSWIKNNSDDEFVGVVDNDSNKLKGVWGYSPNELKNIIFDKIIISNKDRKQREQIYNQLTTIGVSSEKIESLLDNQDLFNKSIVYSSCYAEDKDTRVIWLKDYSKFIYKIGLKGNAAECGVYRGDFSYYINKYFPDRTLYLFDTFEGFDDRDLEKERSLNEDAFINGMFNKDEQFRETMSDRLGKMLPNFEKCIIKKGYFPESAEGVDDKFVFVNLDMDLYQPMRAALFFFYDKMVSGGIILLHDYFHPELPGVAKAVNEFKAIKGNIMLFPIGDGCSIAIIKP
jgi:O-methyltransferase